MLGISEYDWLDGLRQAHFPPERNYLRAHLTMFHHLPPSVEDEVKARLKELTRRPPPVAAVSGLMNLGRGVAFRIDSPELLSIRAELADAFSSLLTPQDQAGWRPHVTIQNKVEPAKAKALLAALEPEFQRRSIEIAGLGLWHYLGGPWGGVGGWRFGQGHTMKLPPPLTDAASRLTAKMPLL